MKNPFYDYSLIHREHIDTLSEIEQGELGYRFGVPDLMHRGLVSPHLHHVTLNPMSWVALRGISIGGRVQVGPSYHLEFLHGEAGTVLGVSRYLDGSVRVDVRLDNRNSTWCFYEDVEKHVDNRHHALSTRSLNGIAVQFPLKLG